MQTRIIGLQFAFFLRDIVNRPDQEFGDLNAQLMNVFDGMPQILPIPPELPAEVPVIMLRSENSIYSCNISRSRIDFFLNRKNDDVSNLEMLKDFNLKVAGLTKYILDKQEVIRFGMVARYFHSDPNALTTLQNKFFTQAVDGTCELSLRFNKKSDAFGYKINDIHEISSAKIDQNNHESQGILIQRDINNDLLAGKHLDYETLSKLSQQYSGNISEAEIEGLIK
ncbi:hypothetical protein ACMXYX_04920 [Neptuniibacter sp. QD72_48]|uniref:hypothetical protein n=1 Tax=Neptuniibacter sp. QD72_48 TaxID=3398214 RepID=UPI0039F47625